MLQSRAPEAIRIGMETGSLSVWLWHELRKMGFPVVCLHARQVAAALSLQVNKTDTNDAFGLAQIVRSGWYLAVEVKSLESHQLRLLLKARSELVCIRTSLYNQMRGLLKTFGIVLGPGKGGTFEHLVRKVPLKEERPQLVNRCLAGQLEVRERGITQAGPRDHQDRPRQRSVPTVDDCSRRGGGDLLGVRDGD